MPPGLAFSMDVHHLNNLKDSNKVTMNNMPVGMERGCIRKEPDSQFSGKATAKIDSKAAAAATTFRRGKEDPYDSDSDPVYHFSYFDPDRFEARLADACDVENCDHLWSLGTIPYIQDNFGLQLTFTWTGGEDIPDSDKSTVKVQPSVESTSIASESHC